MNNKMKIAFVFFCLAAGCGALTMNVYAASISVGPVAWYAWWQPSFKDWLFGESTVPEYLTYRNYQFNKNFNMNPDFLYGGAVSFNISDTVQFANTFLTGTFKPKSSYLTCTIESPPSYAYSKGRQTIRRYDLDSSLGLKIHRFVRIIIGFKYQNFSFINKNVGYTATAVNFTKMEYRNDVLGGGIGLGITIPLAENIFLIPAATLLYQRPIIKIKQKSFRVAATPLPPVSFDIVPDYHYISANSTLSLAWLIPRAFLTISLGFRYQYIFILGNDKLPSIKVLPGPTNYFFSSFPPKLKGKSDHIYGIILSTIFTFDFSKKEQT